MREAALGLSHLATHQLASNLGQLLYSLCTSVNCVHECEAGRGVSAGLFKGAIF